MFSYYIHSLAKVSGIDKLLHTFRSDPKLSGRSQKLPFYVFT